ncbi:MAG: hypothetical protein WCE45_06840 [Sedimentisphaerales bacterium]
MSCNKLTKPEMTEPAEGRGLAKGGQQIAECEKYIHASEKKIWCCNFLSEIHG